jgi:hypothetical protein
VRLGRIGRKSRGLSVRIYRPGKNHDRRTAIAFRSGALPEAAGDRTAELAGLAANLAGCC